MSTIKPEQFGKDHWSLLAYLECLCVDGYGGIGEIDPQRVRCKTNANPALRWRPEWGTRLQGYFDQKDPALRLPDHDDWDCLNDLESAGYIKVLSLTNGHVRMEAKGQSVASMLRAHKAEGRHFASFNLVEQVDA